VRVAMDCALVSAIVKLRLDVNFGDPVTPAPQTMELPALRPGGPPISYWAIQSRPFWLKDLDSNNTWLGQHARSGLRRRVHADR
jgi:hypothetical protein